MVVHAGVPECELATAALAPAQTGQQRVTMLGRAVMPTGGNVAADHGADRLEPLPAHIPVVGVGLQRQPSLRTLRRIFTLTPTALYTVATAVLP